MQMFFSTFLILAFVVFVSAQKNVADLRPEHSAALEKFISNHKNIDFLSQNAIEDSYLKEMGKYFKKKIVPYYQIGDFNRDGLIDFAIILLRKGKPVENGATAEGFEFDYPLLVVIFNGKKGKQFEPVFTREIEAPLYCFLNIVGRKLYFAVFESDADTIEFTPAGKGYIAE